MLPLYIFSEMCNKIFLYQKFNLNENAIKVLKVDAVGNFTDLDTYSSG
jgi:hypothetical protein